MYTVYVLKSLTDGRTYVGCTKDLENRIKEHNSGEVKSTKARTPFILWYKEDFVDKYEAFNREQRFKTSWGRRQLRKILEPLIQDQKGLM
ncbi:MAG: GIY-YIG nuclease family protein [Microgenomates group bacterium]|jgi:putative endonuclease